MAEHTRSTDSVKSIYRQARLHRWSETVDMIQEMVRDCRHSTERWSETADILQEMVRDCRHSTGDDQRLRTQYRR
ncbi:unnamed protein product [Staurois parvus]|uniref:Uncharacterized protein n=1 Tax=Staurois parvus TaxID=386267 RepID=A0ABN9FEQ4_9NEOB|nr:unnamed protein product [Staurois parvus]